MTFGPADFDSPYSTRRTRRGEDVRLHARFDRVGTEALGDGLRGCFYGSVEARGVSCSDLGSERGSFNEPERPVPRRGRMAWHLAGIDRGLHEGGAGSEFARRGNLDATCGSGPRLLRPARKDDPSGGSIRAKTALEGGRYFRRPAESLAKVPAVWGGAVS